MPSSTPRRLLRPALLCAIFLLFTVGIRADPVPVRHLEGLVHGYLTLRTMDHTLVATGDLIQNAHGDRVTSRLVFHFKDGSISDETSVYSQRQNFRLIHDHMIQKGPAFPRSVDMTLDTASGVVSVVYSDDHGQEKTETERMKLPTDLANGITLTLLKNASPAAPPTLSMIAVTPKPRLVKLEITNAGDDPFSTGSIARKATHYVVKIDIGGLAGLIAPLVGKQPPDTHVWVMQGEAPAFVKAEGPMFLGGPIWQIELVSPTWPQAHTTSSR